MQTGRPRSQTAKKWWSRALFTKSTLSSPLFERNPGLMHRSVSTDPSRWYLFSPPSACPDSPSQLQNTFDRGVKFGAEADLAHLRLQHMTKTHDRKAATSLKMENAL